MSCAYPTLGEVEMLTILEEQEPGWRVDSLGGQRRSPMRPYRMRLGPPQASTNVQRPFVESLTQCSRVFPGVVIGRHAEEIQRQLGFGGQVGKCGDVVSMPDGC